MAGPWGGPWGRPCSQPSMGLDKPRCLLSPPICRVKDPGHSALPGSPERPPRFEGLSPGVHSRLLPRQPCCTDAWDLGPCADVAGDGRGRGCGAGTRQSEGHWRPSRQPRAAAATRAGALDPHGALAWAPITHHEQEQWPQVCRGTAFPSPGLPVATWKCVTVSPVSLYTSPSARARAGLQQPPRWHRGLTWGLRGHHSH